VNLLLTGVSGLLGQAVVARLTRDNPFDRVFGIDRTPPAVTGPVQYIEADAAEVDLGDLCVMNSVGCVLHTEQRSPRRQIRGAQAVLEAAALADVRRVVFHGWDQVYRPSESPCDESAPLRDKEGAAPTLLARLRIEEMLAVHQETYADAHVVVVRTCPVVGPKRGTAFDELLELPFLVAPRAADPWVQLLHIDDAGEALVRAAEREGLRGPINVAGPDPIPLSVMAGVLSKPLWRLPEWAAQLGVRALAKAHLARFGLDELRTLHDGVPLAIESARALLDFVPRYSTRQTIAVWRTRYGVAAR